MDSCFALVGARQHSVAKICNASQELTHINCKMTRLLYQVPYFELTCAPKHGCFGAQEDQSVTIGVSESKKKKKF